ncbi:MAG: hypothetical protein V7603_948 [Micromonosporaceae bacterium]
MLALLGVLPLLTYPLLGYAVHPARPVFAPVRLALVRAALILGGGAVVLVELLSAGHALTLGPLALAWSGALVLAAAAAVWRYRRDGIRLAGIGERVAGPWRDASRIERITVVALAGLLVAELVLALGYPPNNFDSQTYHLPKIEHWVAQHDVRFFATRIHRQLSIAPGAEYLLLHLRVLTGGDLFYNLLQWSAGVACAVLASRIAGQLGGSGRAQLLAAFVVGTTPIVALEATSTQTDLVVAGWVACVATLVLDQVRRRTGPVDALLIGTAVGLTGLSKATGLLAAAPLLLIWLVAQVRLARGALPRRLPATALAGLGILAVAVVIAGPYVNRVDDSYGNPLGPPYLRDSISMQRHDPASVLVNALRIGQTAIQPPSTRVNGVTGSAVLHIARWVHVNPDDPKITFPDSHFPAVSWRPDEDHASFPVEAVLVLAGAAALLVRPRRAGVAEQVAVRAYAAAFWVTLLAYVATVKWQPWGNRLILFVFALGAPLAGLWLDAVLRRAAAARSGRRRAWRPAIATGLAAAMLAASGVAGWLAVGVGWPRRLVGTNSLFTESRMQARFNRRPEWLASYERAAAAVRASGAHRVGLVQEGNSWEYPWWVLLRGDTIVALQTLVPSLPAAKGNSVDAIVCAAPAAVCRYYLPRGWQLHMEPYQIGYALPPGRLPASQNGG